MQPNKVTGGGGTDTVATLAGADTIDVRDGGPDTVGCGSEADSVTADRRSVDQVNADCENVDALPEPPAPPSSTTTTSPTTSGPASTTFPALSPAGPTTRRCCSRCARRTPSACCARRASCSRCAAGRVLPRDRGHHGDAARLALGHPPCDLARGARRDADAEGTPDAPAAARAPHGAAPHQRAALTITVNAVDAAGNVVTRTVPGQGRALQGSLDIARPSCLASGAAASPSDSKPAMRTPSRRTGRGGP